MALADTVAPGSTARDGIAAIANTVSEAIVTFTEDGRIRSFNRGASRLFGIDAQGAIGRPIAELLPPALQDEGHPLRALGSGIPESYTGEAVAVRADGQTFPAELSLGVVEVSGVRYGAVVIRDISERKRHEREMLELNARLAEQVKQTRSALARLEQTQGQLVEARKQAALGLLVAGVAHELNTPLGVATTALSTAGDALRALRDALAAGTLKRSMLEEGLRTGAEGVEAASRGVARAAALVQRFRELAAAGRTRAEPVVLDALLAPVLAGLRERLARSGVALETAIPALQVETDADALRRIVSELLANVADHATDARCARVEAGEDEDGWWLAVSDDGPGVPEAERERVFDPFHTSGRGRGHVGLGLHLAMLLATHALGGTLELAPDGAGSRFVLRVPWQRD